MAVFIIYEQQDANSYRAGEQISAKTLTVAKIKAAKAQRYQRTYLKIENLEGDVLATRDESGVWLKRD